VRGISSGSTTVEMRTETETGIGTGTGTETKTEIRTRTRGEGLSDGVYKLLRSDLRQTIALLKYSHQPTRATLSKQQTANTCSANTDVTHSGTSGATHSLAPESIHTATFPTCMV
jgi:hypothetical protein